jgi:hypothetical protein
MSGKIPLERTIGGAYRFLFADLFSILGIVWFPALVFGGLAGAAIWNGAILHTLPQPRFELGHPDLPFILAFLSIVIPVAVCLLLLGVMLITGFTRRALGLMEGTTWFYFNLGASFWRMLVTLFVAGLFLALLNAGLRIVAFLWLRFAAPVLPTGVAVICDVLGALAIAFIFAYAVVRLLFLLPSVVVAEERIGIGRAWFLAGGNFWRAFIALCAVLLPAFIVLGVVSAVLFSGPMRDFPLPPHTGEAHPGGHEMFAYLNRVIVFLLDFLKSNWPLLVAAQLVSWIVTRALFAGASANAYLSLAAQEEEAQPS